MKKKKKQNIGFFLLFSDLVLFTVFIFSIFLVFYSLFKIYNPQEFVSLNFYKICLLIGFSLIISTFFSYKYLNINHKINLSLCLFSVGFIIYSIELFLVITDYTSILKKVSPAQSIENIAKKKEIFFDKRSKLEFIYDLRKSEKKVYPNINPLNFVNTDGFLYNNKKIFPLSSISNSLTVLPNETGFYPVFKTDKYGFNNPNQAYKKKDIVLMIGDSFTEGYAANKDENIASYLRKLNLNVINLGKGGSGPLIEMAILREYAIDIKPKIVLWFFYMNDLNDLNNEMNSQILKKYITDKNFSQNLKLRQTEIDKILTNYIAAEQKKIKDFKNQKKLKDQNELHIKFIDFLKLTKLRNRLNLKPRPSPLFREILQMSKQTIQSWGGEMYFVYLPPINRYLTKKKYHNLEEILQTVKKLDIPIIDIHETAFSFHPDPLSLFPFRIGTHYNNKGYKLIAEEINKRLLRDRSKQ